MVAAIGRPRRFSTNFGTEPKAMVFTAAIGWTVSWLDCVLGSGRSKGLFTGTLLAAWGIGLLTYLGARHLSAATSSESSAHLVTGARLDVASLTWPLLATSLLVPLTIHFLAAQVLFGWMFRDFDLWIAMSTVLVGHCHFALAVLAVRFARTIAAAPERDIDLLVFFGPAPVLLSLLTGIITFGVVTVLVALTGLPMLMVFARLGATARAESSALRAHNGGLETGSLAIVDAHWGGALSIGSALGRRALDSAADQRSERSAMT